MIAGSAIRAKNGDPLERWYTPPHVAEHHLRLLREWCPILKIIDPFAGGGAYGNAARRLDLDLVWESDLERGCGFDDPQIPYADAAVISNPPFSRAAESLDHAFANGARFVSYLLPMSFLDPYVIGRRRWTLEHPPTHEARIGRIKFGGPAREAMIARTGKEPGAMQQYVIATWGRDRPIRGKVWVRLPPPLEEGE